MVKDGESWPCPQQPAWQRVDQNCMSSLLEPKQEEYMPACTNSGSRLLSRDMVFPTYAVPDIPSPRMERTTGAHGLLHCVPPHFPGFLPAVAPYFREKQFMFSHGLSGEALLNEVPLFSQKKLLIFDQCGTQTRLMYSSVCPPITAPINTSRKVLCHYGLHEDEHVAKVNQIDQTKSISHIESAENYGYGDESELHEDTEELNALLYSDDDEDDECSDEVRSTGHSPTLNIASYGNHDQLEEITDEVLNFSFLKKRKMLNMANVENYEEHEHYKGIAEEVSDSNGPNKRQKFLDGGYRMSLMDTASSIKLAESYNSDNYAESSYAMRKTGRNEMGSVSDDKQVKRENIRETLRVLESIVPGVKGKDPLLVLDNAIEYLKCLKFKAITLGVDSLLA